MTERLAKLYGRFFCLPPPALIAVLLLLAFAPAATAEQGKARPVKLPGVSNLYRITPEIYRSQQPNALGLRSLAAHGIRTVINLRNDYDDTDDAFGTGLKLVHIPMNASESGSDSQALAILGAIRRAKKPVLIHCQHGADRAGMAVALYRMVEQGWSNEEAVREMRQAKFGLCENWYNIPDYLLETDAKALRLRLDRMVAPESALAGN